jgi:hypothetical protein
VFVYDLGYARCVIPAKAGIQGFYAVHLFLVIRQKEAALWTPAFAGVTAAGSQKSEVRN